MLNFYGIEYSPWSLKARWALDHHQVDYRFCLYVPILHEPALRWRMNRPFGKVTVPVLMTRNGIYDDSWSIAEHAERIGTGSPLFPREHRSEIATLDARMTHAMAVARRLLSLRYLHDDQALALSTPGFVPASWRAPLGKVGVKYILNKYQGSEDMSEVDELLRSLDERRAGRDYILGDLSYLDFSLAALLQLVAPLGSPKVKLSRKVLPVWRDPARAQDFDGLVRWRDAFAAQHVPDRI